MKTRARWGTVAVTLVVSTAVAALAPAALARATPRAATTGAAAYEHAITDAVTAIQAYWRREFPVLYGERYIAVPTARVIAAAPGVKLPTCQGHRLTYQDAAENAFYCFDDNFVVYDDAKLFPQLYEDYGGFALALVLAHEWGHAIQDRAGTDNEPTIDQELQADCFAGAWTDQQSDRSSGPDLRPGDLESSLAAMLSFRDQPGTSPDDPSAHGSAFDRVSAFQEGFESGPERCAGYFESPPLVVELPFAPGSDDEASGGEIAAEDVIPLTVELLNAFYALVEPEWIPLDTGSIESFDSSKRGSIPECGAGTPTVKQVRNRVYYCIDDEYIAFDEPYLQHVYDDIGDFGVTSLLASPFATRAQTIQGEPGVANNDLAVVFQADCYTGGFMAALYNGVFDEASLSPGDLDELIEAFLEYSRARGVSADVPITFLRLGYIRRGFFSGYQSCDLATIQDEVKHL